jgi:hypothetical protein
MLTDELLQLVASQPEVRETRNVKVWGPSLRAAVDSGQLRALDKILSHRDQTSEIKTFRYGHLVGNARRATDVEAWQARFPDHPLPADLADFLLRVDGVHLWADLDQGRAYFGIAPLDEWQDAAATDAPALFDERPTGMLVISYHQNGDYYLVLDARASVYRWFDHEDTSSPRVIGTTVRDLLDWLWEQASELRPAASGAG